MYDAEKETLGHARAGQWRTALDVGLAASCRDFACRCARRHNPQNVKDHADIVALCHFADCLCYELKPAVDEDYAPPKLDRAL